MARRALDRHFAVTGTSDCRYCQRRIVFRDGHVLERALLLGVHFTSASTWPRRTVYEGPCLSLSSFVTISEGSAGIALRNNLPDVHSSDEAEVPIHRQPRVLVIDDEPVLCRLFMSAASRLDLEVTTAGSGSTALILTRELTFDVIVLDLRMPGMSGLAVLQALRAEGNRTPVVIYTAFPAPDSALEAGHWGAVRYLEKRTPLTAVAEALREAAALPAMPPLAARRVQSPPGPTSAWMRASAWARTQTNYDATLLETAASGDILNLFIEASLDVDGTTLPQFALLATVVRAAFADPRTLRAAAQELLAVAAAATALSDEVPEPLAMRLLLPFANSLGLHQAALAHDLGMDASTVRRHLRHFFGCGFHELRWAALIRPGVLLAAKSIEPIGNIAIDCGCGTDRGLRQFHRAWARVLGLTAGEFRHRCAG